MEESPGLATPHVFFRVFRVFRGSSCSDSPAAGLLTIEGVGIAGYGPWLVGRLI